MTGVSESRPVEAGVEATTTVEATAKTGSVSEIGAPANADLRNTLVLVVFTAVTNLADGVTKVVLPLLAVRLTHSPMQVTGVALTLTLPWLLTALHIGAVVDRLDRRRLVIAANAMRVVAVTGLLIAVAAGKESIPLLYGAGLALGIAEVVALTAAAALVPAAVTSAGRDRVNSWMTAAETACNEFCGPFVGGALVAAGYVFALTSSSFAYLATLLLPLLLLGRFRPTRSAGATALPGRAEIAAGMRFLWRSPLLRTMALTLTVLCLCWGAWLGLIPLFVTQESKVGAVAYGLVLSGLGIGGLAGAVSTVPLNRLFGRRWVMFADLMGTFAMVGVPVVTANPVALGVSAFLGGLGGTLWAVNARTLSQQLVPPELMGRFHAAWRLLSWGALPIGSAIVGGLAEVVGLRTAFLPFAIATALLVVPFFRVITAEAVAGAEATLTPPQTAAAQSAAQSGVD
ncbi:MFS transporter [Dactylosporangium cerinum]|uniref:MFS transporter n=1 Tax=Dactylosporangium cerinum TaxID=1434730 RepID=A0ABV9W2U0_9ACTN